MVTTKLLFCLILCYELTNALAIPRPDNLQHTNQETPTTSEKLLPLTPKQHLYTFTFDGFSNLTDFYVTRAANISEHILKYATLNLADNSDNTVVREFKQNLTDFLSRYQNHKEFKELFVLTDFYWKTTTDYYEMTQEQLTTETTLIVNVLRKYGSEQLDKQLKERYDKFVKEFCEEFKKVQNHLDKNFLDWFDQFKELTDIDARTGAFDRFLLFYV